MQQRDGKILSIINDFSVVGKTLPQRFSKVPRLHSLKMFKVKMKVKTLTTRSNDL